MDATTRQIIAFHVGDRSRESGKELWAHIPMVYREQATFHTDQYEVYKGAAIPADSLAASASGPNGTLYGRFESPCGSDAGRMMTLLAMMMR